MSQIAKKPSSATVSFCAFNGANSVVVPSYAATGERQGRTTVWGSDQETAAEERVVDADPATGEVPEGALVIEVIEVIDVEAFQDDLPPEEDQS